MPVSRGEFGYLRDYGVDLKLMKTMDDVAEFKRWLGERRELLGFDTETNSLRPDFGKIRLAQFGDMKTGWAIPYGRWSGVVTEVLHKYTGEIVLHNSKFDSRFFCADEAGFQWPWHRTHDTMTMAHLVNPLRPKGLKPLSGLLIDPQAVAAQKMLDDGMHDNKWNWETVPLDFPPYWIYAAMDPVLTCHNASILLPEVKEKYSEAYDLEMGTTRVIAKMEAKGARINVAYTREEHARLLTWTQQAHMWLHTECGMPIATSGRVSPAAQQKWFRDQGIEIPTKFTKSGKQALDKEVLQGIDHPVAAYILKIRHAEKNVGPYFSNFLNLVDDEDRVHPNIWTMGTRTARMSITDPALQTLPRKDPMVRRAFIPSEGNSLITCDYDQIEARLMAHFGNSPGLIAAFNDLDHDFFLTIASQIFSETITNKKDSRRDLTKGVTYGKIYGAGVGTMARTAKVAEEQMDMVNAMFDHLYPEVRIMQAQVGAVAQQRLMDEGAAYVLTPTGRRLMADDGKAYTLVNYLIQSHAAEILKRKIVELDTIIPDYMILPVHDELVFDVPTDDHVEVRQIIEETMTDMTTYRVPITASSDLMHHNWGEKYQ